MGTLYIIGNGFDLHFELKTKTEHFLEYLKSQSIYNEIDSALDILDSYGIDWCEYEQSLNDIDLDEIEFQNEILPDYLSDRESDRDGGIVNMQIYVESINDAINSALKKMVHVANDDAIKQSLLSDKRNLFEDGDAILSFNYTSTIEYLFYTPKKVPIFHIHGCYAHGDPLIFGYKNNENSYTNDWVSNNEENWDYYVEQQREIVYAFYNDWRKQLQLDKLNAFLAKLYQIDKVVVLGHSMSYVDSEYMEQIEKCICPTIWEVSYYDMDDINRIKDQEYSFQNKIRFAYIEKLLKE